MVLPILQKKIFGITVDSETDYTLYFEKNKNITGTVFVFEYDENEMGSTNTQVAQTYKTISELKGAINFTTTSNTKYICFRLGVSKSENTVIYKNIMLLKGTYTVDNIPTYEQYGASPSPDYPSEIETLNGSVKIDVVNKNLLNMNDLEEQLINGITYSIKNNVLKLRGTATANKTLIFNNKKEVNLKADTYTLSVNKSGTITGTFGYYIYPDSGSQIIDGGNLGNTNNTGTKTQILNNEYQNCKFGIFFAAGCVIDVTLKVQLENGSIARKFAEHQSQTAIMPVQQEMLNGDYIADIEHHEWEKLILTGDEDWHKSSTTEVDRFSYNTSEYPAFADGLSNYFLVQKGIGTNVGTLVFNAGTQIVVNFSDYGTTTLEEFKAWLKSKYDAGNPVTIYYKLATPTNLELTTEQKAIRDTKLNTYKNVTNISLSDELASIDVEYKKDLETINKNYENRLAALEAASIS